jgi:hypothetical protein
MEAFTVVIHLHRIDVSRGGPVVVLLFAISRGVREEVGSRENRVESTAWTGVAGANE